MRRVGLWWALAAVLALGACGDSGGTPADTSSTEDVTEDTGEPGDGTGDETGDELDADEPEDATGGGEEDAGPADDAVDDPDDGVDPVDVPPDVPTDPQDVPDVGPEDAEVLDDVPPDPEDVLDTVEDVEEVQEDAGPDAEDVPPEIDEPDVPEPDCVEASDCTDQVEPGAQCVAVSCEDGTCVFGAAEDGSPCDDSDVCTSGDACLGGACVGSAADCSPLDGPCAVGVCDPAAGACVAQPLEDGTSCTDGDACTALDACSDGECEGSPVICSNLDDVCVVGVCDPGSGQCVTENAEDGSACDDGEACTADDACDDGSCAGAPVSCEGVAGPCETAACEPGTGECETTPVQDGTGCNDDDPCTIADSCTAGSCGGTAVDCSEEDGPCTTGACDADTGTCVALAFEDGLACDDDSLCTDDDTCLAGACVGVPTDCSPLDGPCASGSCDPATGQCVQALEADGLACDDDDACTNDDACLAGECVGDVVECGDLDDICKMGTCNAETGACEQLDAEDGTACDSGIPCTVGAICTAGACGGDVLDCTGLDDDCNDGVCDTDNGVCLTVPKNEAGSCDDGDLCTVNDLCFGGTCTGAPINCSVFDGTCALGTCDSGTGLCTPEPVADGEDCDDGNPCTVDDACTAGICGGADVDCSDDDGPCTLGVCNLGTGDCEAVALDEGAACDDDDPCTDLDMCTSGSCGGSPKDCPAAGPCFEGSCHPETGACEQGFKEDGAICDDDNLCTGGDVCALGVCAGVAIDCSGDAPLCFEATCDLGTGLCVTIPVQDGTDCTESDPCLASAVCIGGNCLGSEKDCSELNGPCAVGKCSDIAGDCYPQPLPEFTPCDDQSLCTSSDHCETGECVGTTISCSFLDTDCEIGVCDPGTGGCGLAPGPDGNPCNDFNPCTESDQCTDGVCGGIEPDCSDLDGNCLVGVCNPGSGTCISVAAEQGTPCDDENPCTDTDQCSGTFCSGTEINCSTPLSSCTTGYCDPTVGCVVEPLEEGAGCDDGDACTLFDACTEGQCVGEALDCTELDGPCTVGVCDVDLSACALEVIPTGDPCSDGNPCTLGDICVASQCVGDDDPTIPGCGPAGECVDPPTLVAVPEQVSGDTTGAGTSFAAAGCSMQQDGTTTPDLLYRFVAPEAATYLAALVPPPPDSTGASHVLYAFDDCPGLPEATCLDGDETPDPVVGHQIVLHLDEGASAWIVVDGDGPFVLSIEAAPPTEVGCDDDEDSDYDGATDCFDSDCYGVGDCPSPLPVGSVAFTEVMGHPVPPLANGTGEWVELRNVSADEQIVHGLRIAYRTWTAEEPLPTEPDGHWLVTADAVLAAGGTAVVASTSDPVANGGIEGALVAAGLLIADDELVRLQLVSAVWDPGTPLPHEHVVDEITIPQGTFSSGGLGAGASWAFDGELLVELDVAERNDNAFNWCLTSVDVGTEYAAENHGTPGEDNPGCGNVLSYAAVKPVLEDKCGACHLTAPCEGGVCFAAQYADTQLPSQVCEGLLVFECMLARIQDGSMPDQQGCTGNPDIDAAFLGCLDHDDQGLVEAWVNAGAPP